MRRMIVVLVLATAIAACSDAKPDRDLDALTTTSVAGLPDWLAGLGAPTTVEEGVTIEAGADQERVWVDKEKRMVYARTCELARTATAEGAYYGPGNFGAGPGFAYVCP